MALSKQWISGSCTAPVSYPGYNALHSWVFGRTARLPRSGTALALLAIGLAMTRRAVLPRYAGDALCFPENPSAKGITWGSNRVGLVESVVTITLNRNAMADFPDLTETELWIVNTTLKERYGREMELQLGDAELRISPADKELTSCPVAHWNADGCNFVVFKTGERNYRGQFFYRLYQQYGTGRHEYDDLAECLVDLLQTQADYSAKERGDLADK